MWMQKRCSRCYVVYLRFIKYFQWKRQISIFLWACFFKFSESFVLNMINHRLEIMQFVHITIKHVVNKVVLLTWMTEKVNITIRFHTFLIICVTNDVIGIIDIFIIGKHQFQSVSQQMHCNSIKNSNKSVKLFWTSIILFRA